MQVRINKTKDRISSIGESLEVISVNEKEKGKNREYNRKRIINVLEAEHTIDRDKIIHKGQKKCLKRRRKSFIKLRVQHILGKSDTEQLMLRISCFSLKIKKKVFSYLGRKIKCSKNRKRRASKFSIGFNPKRQGSTIYKVLKRKCSLQNNISCQTDVQM